MLTGPVAGVLHPQALVMSENENAWTAEEALLVVGPDDVIPTESDPEALYQVRGTVHIFDPAELELGEEYRFLTLDDSFAEFEGEPILVAEMVDLALVPDVLGVLDAILDNPHSFIDEAVDISGNVVELVGTSAFTVGSDEGDGELLVVTSDPTLMADLEAGGPVTASGTVRLFDLEVIEEESGIDLDDELFADFDGKPVIVADAVSAEGS